MANSIIKIDDVSFSYEQKQILKDISLEVDKGSFLAIAGPNGAGKTTLLNLVTGLIRPQKGTVKIDEKEVCEYCPREIAQKIAIVRQEFVPVFDFNVRQVVSMSRTPYQNAFGFDSKEDEMVVSKALKMTDTEKFESRSLAHLSGGERQRVFIARALAQNTDILLLDEPTTYLDLKHQVEIFDLLKKMQNEQNKTIMMITHDINLAAQYCDKLMLVADDSTYRIGETQQLINTQQIYETFKVKGYTSQILNEKFFLPLGNYSKDIAAIENEKANPSA